MKLGFPGRVVPSLLGKNAWKILDFENYLGVSLPSKAVNLVDEMYGGPVPLDGR